MILGGCSTQKITDSSSQKEETQEAKNQDISEKSTDGEADESQEASKDVFAMDTYMTVTAYGSHGEEAVEKAVTEIERLDGLLSTGEESSEIAQVNANGGGTLGKDASYLVERALEFGESTDGAFDIAIYPIMAEWGFTTGDFKVPSKETLDSLLEKTKLSDVVFDKETSTVSFKTDGDRFRRNCERIYFYQNYGYLSGMWSKKRSGESGRKCTGTWHKNRWK